MSNLQGRINDASRFTRHFDPGSPVQARITEIRMAHRKGSLHLTHGRVLEIILSAFKPYQNGDYGIRNAYDDVMTDAMIAEEYERRHGETISVDTICATKKRAAVLFDWWRWGRTPAGCSYRMDPHGVMRGKYPVASRGGVVPKRHTKIGNIIQANPHRCGFGKSLSMEEGLSVRKERKTITKERLSVVEIDDADDAVATDRCSLENDATYDHDSIGQRDFPDIDDDDDGAWWSDHARDDAYADVPF